MKGKINKYRDIGVAGIIILVIIVLFGPFKTFSSSNSEDLPSLPASFKLINNGQQSRGTSAALYQASIPNRITVNRSVFVTGSLTRNEIKRKMAGASVLTKVFGWENKISTILTAEECAMIEETFAGRCEAHDFDIRPAKNSNGMEIYKYRMWLKFVAREPKKLDVDARTRFKQSYRKFLPEQRSDKHYITNYESYKRKRFERYKEISGFCDEFSGPFSDCQIAWVSTRAFEGNQVPSFSSLGDGPDKNSSRVGQLTNVRLGYFTGLSGKSKMKVTN